MSNRAIVLIRSLELQPHPEGGHFREVYRSTATVRPADGRPDRSALTTIYFLLKEGQYSRIHRVASEEVWHHYEGGMLQLLWWNDQWQPVGHVLLGPVEDRSQPVAVVPAGCWQAAVPLGDYTLVGCTVAPGFDFADFSILRDDRQRAENFRRAQQEWSHLV